MVDCYHMNLTLSGQTSVSQRGVRAHTEAGHSGVIFVPDDPFIVRWSPEATQYAIKLPRRALEAQLGKLLNRPIEMPIDFKLGFDLDNGPGRSLLSAVAYLRHELMRPNGLAEMPLAREQLESYVLTQILLTLPHAYSDELAAHARAPRRNRIHEIIELIQHEPDRDLSLAELADAAGVTARALQRGFKEHVGVSPTTYLRNVRLDRAHADLMAEAGSSSVTDIAMRWGFFHFGRFAQQYRERFGVVPSETVRRSLANGA
jgi:AraC-like DNA-binding protein